MRLKAVTYSSFAAPGVQPADIDRILAVSRHNNADDGITGLLMSNGAGFVQVIEGPEAPIDALVMKLRRDRRHCEMTIGDERLATRRVFADWKMGYVRLDGGWLESQQHVADALARELPSGMRELVAAFAITLPFA